MVRFVFLFIVCAACGGSGGVEPALAAGDVPAALRVYRAEREHEALRRIAEHVLVGEARSAADDASARAWALLRGLGPAALPAWAELEREPGDHHVRRVRAHALAARAALADAPARRGLRALLEDDDPEIVALAVTTLDAHADVERLRALAQDPASSVRGAALQRLAQAAGEAATLDLLTSRARLDPVASVRASAARALVAQGPAAIATLEALSDEAAPAPSAPAPADPKAKVSETATPKANSPDLRGVADSERVRAAALAALAQLAPERAAPRIAALLAGAPSGLSLQLAQDAGAQHEQAALAHVAHALADRRDTSAARLLRERAALAAMVAAARPAARAVLLPALEAQLAVERDRPTRLLLAIAAQRVSSERGAAELTALSRGQDMAAAQAAAELAPRDRAARERLNALARHADPAVRATCASASAASFDFERTPASAASLRALEDDDARVRAPVAAALLRALERLRAATGR